MVIAVMVTLRRAKGMATEIEVLTFEKINAYLERKNAEHPCEACGEQDWMVHANEFQEIVFLSLPFAKESGTYTFLPLICNSCGNTRFFHTAKVIEDIMIYENKPSEDSNDG